MVKNHTFNGNVLLWQCEDSQFHKAVTDSYSSIDVATTLGCFRAQWPVWQATGWWHPSHRFLFKKVSTDFKLIIGRMVFYEYPTTCIILNKHWVDICMDNLGCRYQRQLVSRLLYFFLSINKTFKIKDTVNSQWIAYQLLVCATWVDHMLEQLLVFNLIRSEIRCAIYVSFKLLNQWT